MKYLLLIIIAIAAAAPYGTSMLVEKQYNTAITNLNQAYKDKLTFQGSFSKGYLNSHATTQIINVASKETITLQHTIQNGPVILKFNGWLDASSYIPQGYKLAVVDTTISGSFDQKMQQLYKQGAGYKITTNIAYNGDGITTMVNQPLSLPIFFGTLKWGGLNIELKHDKGFSNLSLDAKAPSISYKESAENSNKELSIVDLHFNFVQQLLTLQSAGNFGIASILIKENDKDILNLNQVKMDFNEHANADKTLADFEINYNFDKLIVESHTFGSFSFKIKANNINIAAVRKLEQINQQASQEQQKKIAAQLLAEMFASKPSSDLNLQLQTSKGKMIIVSNITANSVADVDLSTKEGLRKSINATTSMTFDVEVFYALLARYAADELKAKEQDFAQKNPNTQTNPYKLSKTEMDAKIEAWMMILLDRLKNEQWIVEKDNKVNIDFKLNDNAITINSVAKTDDDWKNLQPYLEITLEQIPAPEQKLQPEIVPNQPAQTPQQQQQPEPAVQ